jgi:hypothetical protein
LARAITTTRKAKEAEEMAVLFVTSETALIEGASDSLIRDIPLRYIHILILVFFLLIREKKVVGKCA